MNLTDKVLLGLLIILLPLGLVISRELFKPQDPETSDERTEQLKKIEVLLDEISSKETTSSPIQPQAQQGPAIQEVQFASRSGTLKLRGNQANYNAVIRVFITEYLPQTLDTQNLAVINAKALGKPVKIEAIKPNADGSFEYEYLPDDTSVHLDITIEQQGKVDTIVYDLATQKLLYEANP